MRTMTEGMVRLDESLAAVAGGEVDDLFVIEEIFCQMFSACERAHDVARAEQWLRVGEAVAAQRDLPAVVAYCHTHFGGVMTAAGRWPEAEAALTDAIRIWALGWRALKSGALARLADLRIRQGRLEEAEQLLTGLSFNEECAPRSTVSYGCRWLGTSMPQRHCCANWDCGCARPARRNVHIDFARG